MRHSESHKPAVFIDAFFWPFLNNMIRVAAKRNAFKSRTTTTPHHHTHVHPFCVVFKNTKKIMKTKMFLTKMPVN